MKKTLRWCKLLNYMTSNELDLVKNSLKNLYSLINNNDSMDNLEIKKAGQTLQKILLTKIFNISEQQKLTIFMKKNNMLPLFQKTYEKFETNLEAEFAHLLINKRRSVKKTLMNEYPIYSRYVISLKNEIKLAKIGSKDKVLFVGSGPFPITAILVHELTHSQIDCVEINKSSAELSKRVIDYLNYSDSIHTINKDALDIDYSEYTVIVIAILAKPQDKIIEVIWKQISQGSRIIYRTPDLIRQAFYEKTKVNILKKYRLFEKGKIGDKRTISSVLLVKN